jgi:hypothetical protein
MENGILRVICRVEEGNLPPSDSTDGLYGAGSRITAKQRNGSLFKAAVPKTKMTLRSATAKKGRTATGLSKEDKVDTTWW